MPQDYPGRAKRNLDEPEPKTTLTGPSPADIQKSHQRLFGPNAKMSTPQGRDADLPAAASADYQALAQRPRAATAGKDIELPVEKKPVRRAATTSRRATKR